MPTLIEVFRMKKMIEIDPDKMTFNPFSQGLKIEVTRVLNGHSRIGPGGIITPESFQIEKANFTKVFRIKGIKKKVCDLSDSALRLYMYFIHSIDSGCDYLQMNYEHYMFLNKVRSRATVRKALDELTTVGFICKSVYPGVYWINPGIFFNGSRIEKYPDNCEESGKPITKRAKAA